MYSKAFSGRIARGVRNAFTQDRAQAKDLPSFPHLNVATGPLRKASAQQGSPDAFALWSGQGAGQVRDRATTAQVIEKIAADADALLN